MLYGFPLFFVPFRLNSSQPRQDASNFALDVTQQSVDCADKLSTLASTFSNKSPTDLAAQILQCQTWAAMVQEIDAVSAIRQTTRDIVFEIVVTKYLNKDDRQHLVCLLANQIQQFPQDNSTYSWLPQSCQELKDEANALAQNSKGRIG